MADGPGDRVELDARRVGLPIVLVGPMGAGKTRVGGRLAASVGAPYVDTDQRLAERYGPIDDIFAREGEDYFRIIEREVVGEALLEEAVISLGGGAVLHVDTRFDLAALDVVWLDVSTDAAEPRLVHGRRPLIADGGMAAWERIRAEREPLYREVAGLRIDTSRRSVGRIVEEIIEWAEASE